MTEPQAFTAELRRCFRYVIDDAGRKQRCLNPPQWRGTFRGPDQLLYVVDACPDHVGDVDDPKPLGPSRH